MTPVMPTIRTISAIKKYQYPCSIVSSGMDGAPFSSTKLVPYMPATSWAGMKMAVAIARTNNTLFVNNSPYRWWFSKKFFASSSSVTNLSAICSRNASVLLKNMTGFWPFSIIAAPKLSAFPWPFLQSSDKDFKIPRN